MWEVRWKKGYKTERDNRRRGYVKRPKERTRTLNKNFSNESKPVYSKSEPVDGLVRFLILEIFEFSIS